MKKSDLLVGTLGISILTGGVHILNKPSSHEGIKPIAYDTVARVYTTTGQQAGRDMVPSKSPYAASINKTEGYRNVVV